MNGGNIVRPVVSLWDLSYLSTAWTHRVTPLAAGESTVFPIIHTAY
jgi:hypothetical protein